MLLKCEIIYFLLNALVMINNKTVLSILILLQTLDSSYAPIEYDVSNCRHRTNTEQQTKHYQLQWKIGYSS
jgi:hypothetical protein